MISKPLSSPSEGSPAPGAGQRRRLGWGGVIALWLAFAFVPAVIDFIAKGSFDNYFPNGSRVAALMPGRFAALLLVVVVITTLGWWHVVLNELSRARAWVWIVVALPLGLATWFIDRDNIAESGWQLLLGVMAIALLIGFAEELFFRGVMLTAIRDRYQREWLAVLITTLVFGLSHFSGGVPNVLSTIVAGFLYYWMRRVSGGIWVPALMHSLFDFAIFSSYMGPEPATTDALSLSAFFVGVVLSLVLLVFHRSAAGGKAEAGVQKALPPDQE